MAITITNILLLLIFILVAIILILIYVVITPGAINPSPTSLTTPDAATILSTLPGDTLVTLSWNIPSNGGEPITSYRLEWSDDNFVSTLGSETIGDDESLTTTFTVTGLTNGAPYTFQVLAINSIGTGYPSSTLTVTPHGFVDSFSISLQDASPRGVDFSDDGTQMFVLGNNNLSVFSYDLSNSFDVSTATYDNSFSLSAQDTNLIDIAFSTDGYKMFVVGHTNDYVSSYTLSTAYDVSTATYTDNFSIITQDGAPRGLEFSTDGTQMFMVGNVNDKVYAYTLSNSWDITTATFADEFLIVFGSSPTPTGLAFSSDGMTMFVLDNNHDNILSYDLATSFDITTATYDNLFSVFDEDTSVRGIAFSKDGLTMIIPGNDGDDINEYYLPATFAFN